MCIIAIYNFACGHELRHPVSHCPEFVPSDHRSNESNCGYISFEPIRVASECAEASCRYWGDLQCSWRCCQCRNGPNNGAKCVAEVERVLGVPSRDCVHAWCDTCEPWERSDNGRKKVGLMDRLFGKKRKGGKGVDQRDVQDLWPEVDRSLRVQRRLTPKPSLAAGS